MGMQAKVSGMLWPVDPIILTVNKLFQILPTCTGEVYNIAGYPEYSPDPKKLAPEQQKVLSDLALLIVNSWKTNSPIVAFMVIGHADVALKKPESERAAYEQDVSESGQMPLEMRFSHISGICQEDGSSLANPRPDRIGYK
jgi:hypothetical protein